MVTEYKVMDKCGPKCLCFDSPKSLKIEAMINYSACSDSIIIVDIHDA